MKHTAVTYRAELEKAAEPFLALMMATWNYRPEVVFDVQEALGVDVVLPRVPLWSRRGRQFIYLAAERLATSRRPEALAHRIARIPVRRSWRRVSGAQAPTTTTPSKYRELLVSHLTSLGVWGEGSKANVVRCLLASARFNIKGFPHRGRRVYIRPTTEASRRSPAAVARMFLQEVTSHRNACKECGEGIASLHARSRFGPQMEDRSSKKRLEKVFGRFTAPDAVERALHPVLSKQVDVFGLPEFSCPSGGVKA